MSDVYYEVRIKYYKYNDGDGISGERYVNIAAHSMNLAKDLSRKINKLCLNDEDSEEASDLALEFLPSHGYFINAKVFLVIKELIDEDELETA